MNRSYLHHSPKFHFVIIMLCQLSHGSIIKEKIIYKVRAQAFLPICNKPLGVKVLSVATHGHETSQV